MKYLNILWIIFGSLLINTWRDIIVFLWMRRRIDQKEEEEENTLKED